MRSYGLIIIMHVMFILWACLLSFGLGSGLVVFWYSNISYFIDESVVFSISM